jgi:hypothetical protein
MINELVKYSIQHMCSKEFIYKFYEKYNIEFRRNDTYLRLANRIDHNNDLPFSLSELTHFFRHNWKSCPKDIHINDLKSGLLKGHSWHGAMPSILHRSMQQKVRDRISGKMDLDKLINIGADIMKHEYFMVATHDLLETTIIEEFPKTIPPISKRSVSDFIFNEIPYDLKNTNPIMGFKKSEALENKIKIIKKFLEGADINRFRRQASRTYNNWGLNKFFVIVYDQERWIYEPEELLKEFVDECRILENPIIVKIDDIEITTQIIII